MLDSVPAQHSMSLTMSIPLLRTPLSLSDILTTVQRNTHLSLAFLFGFSLLLIVRYHQSPWRRLPPGPKGLPLLGNIFQLGPKQWLTFADWRKTYGDLIYLNAAGQPILVLNSQKVAADLLDRRAANYSGRARNLVAADILAGGLLMVFNQHSDIWRRMRKAAHEGLNKTMVQNYNHKQTSEAALLTSGILTEPQFWDQHLRRTAASTIMSVMYDSPTITSEHDPSVSRINDFVYRLTRAALPGAHFVEFFPWMMYIPSWLAKWKREAEEWFVRDTKLFEGLYLGAQGEGRKSFSGTLMEDDRFGLSLREKAWLVGGMYAAGAETTSGVLAWWMLAMTAYPETQRRAQAELDAVVGRSRIPSFADFEHLPYIRAMVKEALRWHSVTPFAMPHLAVEDDWYEGYFIPAGTMCIPNVWHINRDPEIYGPDATHFNPARHLDAEGRVAQGPADTKEESHCSFGFGRRLCVGRNVANNSLFIDIAMMLWAANIEPATDASGKPTPLDLEGCIDDGLVIRPVPFECKITPRFPEALAILEQEQEILGK